MIFVKRICIFAQNVVPLQRILNAIGMKLLQQIWNFGINHPWFLPIVVLCLFGVLSLLTLLSVPSRPLMICVEGLLYILGGIILLSVVLMFATTFGVFYRNKNVAECMGLLGINILTVVIGFGTQIFAGIKNPDPYAFSHPIPKGVMYNIPIENDLEHNICSLRHEAVNESDTTTWLQVSTDFTGCFAYTFYYHALQAGDIFLRCYEVGTNDPLSADKIEQSSLSPAQAENAFCCQVRDKHFVIYEGAPMQYYVARFEVWYRSADTHQEIKLLDKLYRVDGYEH